MTTSPPGLFPFFLRKSPGDEFELRILQAKFSWIPDSTSKNFSDTAIRISLHGILFRGSQWGGLFDGLRLNSRAFDGYGCGNLDQESRK